MTYLYPVSWFCMISIFGFLILNRSLGMRFITKTGKYIYKGTPFFIILLLFSISSSFLTTFGISLNEVFPKYSANSLGLLHCFRIPLGKYIFSCCWKWLINFCSNCFNWVPAFFWCGFRILSHECSSWSRLFITYECVLVAGAPRSSNGRFEARTAAVPCFSSALFVFVIVLVPSITILTLRSSKRLPSSNLQISMLCWRLLF